MAKVIDYDMETKGILSADHAAADPDYAKVTRPEHFQMARALVGTLRNFSTRLKLNKAIIDFSLPSELVRTILRPQWACWPHRQWGLGHQRKYTVPPVLYWFLDLTFTKVMASRLAPLIWHLAPGFAVSKHNLLPGIKGERLVVSMCPWGRLFYEVALATPLFYDQDERPVCKSAVRTRDLAQIADQVGDWQFGCVPGRRREEAMMIQNVHGWALARQGYFQAGSLYDGSNAFYSLKRSAVLTAAQPPFTPTMREFYMVKQRARYSVVTLGPPDARVYLLMGTGTLPGDHCGPRLFNRTIHDAGSAIARRHAYRDPHKAALRMRTPLAGRARASLAYGVC